MKPVRFGAERIYLDIYTHAEKFTFDQYVQCRVV